MNYALRKELYDVEQRWLLGAGEAQKYICLSN